MSHNVTRSQLVSRGQPWLPPMTEPARTGLFPLRLAAFEEYMFLDDRPDQPMTGVLAMRFRGTFDRPAFEAALDDALRRNPLFWALVDARRRKPCWIAAPAGRPPLEWQPPHVPLDCPNAEALDLRREPGFRMWIQQGGEQATLTFLGHHAVADAIGMTQFLGDVLAGYAVRRSSHLPPRALPAPMPQRLGERGLFRQSAPQPVSAWAATRFLAREAVKWFGRRALPLEAPRSAAAADEADPFPGIHVHTFDVAQTNGLRDRAARQGGTLNDLLLRDLFVTMRAWNDQSGTAGGQRGNASGWLRIAMPTNLREPLDQYMPAANKMSYAFLTRRPAACDDRGTLLAGLRAETAAIKHWRLSRTFVHGLETLLRVPGAMRWILSGRRCLATAVLSNLGDPGWHFWTDFPRQDGLLTMGDVSLREFIASPPLRALTRACFLAVRYADRLTISLRCDRHLFRPADARRLLALYIDQLGQTLAEP